MSQPTTETIYMLYDGRYYNDPDSAIVFEVCESLKEAKESAPDHGTNTAIVKARCEGSMIVEKTLIQ